MGRWRAFALLLLSHGALALGDEPRPAPTPPPTQPVAPEPRESEPPVVPPEFVGPPKPAPQPPPSERPAETKPVADADPVATRASAQEQLKALPPPGDKEATGATKALREVLEERLKWLDEWDKAAKERHAAEHPEPNPEKQAAEWKSELERTAASVNQVAKDPDAFLPAVFRKLGNDVPEETRAELKEAIDAAQNELKEWTTKLEQLRADTKSKDDTALAALRARRDKTHQRVAALEPRNLERETALNEAKTSESRALAREKLVNLQWEARVEAARLAAVEASLKLETRRSELVALHVQLLVSHVQLSQKNLDRMKGLYRQVAALQERDLKLAANQEKNRAKVSDDPVEKYRAKRNAELLELQAKVLDTENLLTTSPPPTLDEQRALADRAETDFNNVKKLLDDGRISHLDALRLNNDFRRIDHERSRAQDNELAMIGSRLTAAENALSEVELELIFDPRDDRFELDSLLERLPREHHARATAVFDELERKHLVLLTRRRDALQKLASRAEQTYEQIQRRLGTLEDHYGFIRTNIFWVRDEEPLGTATINQGRRDAVQLARSASRMAEEFWDRSAWGWVSPEFVSAGVVLVVMPWPLVRMRSALKAHRPRRGSSPRATHD